MSPISFVAASVAFVLVITAGPAQDRDIELSKPVSPGVGAISDGGATTQNVWTWVCQVILGQCK